MKAQQQEEQIWQYFDGALNDAERAAFQQRLTQDAALQDALQTRQILHQHLQQIEPEQPSMRFIMNVMDRLPILYKKAIEPLVHPNWIKAFLGGFVAFVLALVGYAAVAADSVTSGSIPGESMIERFNALPISIFTTLAIISFSYLFFVILDQQLKKRFAKK